MPTSSSPRLAPFLLAIFLLLPSCASSPALTADSLLCESRENPQGIPNPTPRLSWSLRATNPHQRALWLSAFQVIAAESPEALDAGAPLLWDSGIVMREPAESAPPLQPRILFASRGQSTRPLTSRDQVWWKVRIWDQASAAKVDSTPPPPWSKTAFFSLGLLEQSDWRAQWIGLDTPPLPPLTADIRDELRSLPWIRQPGPQARTPRTAFFRAEFDLPDPAHSQIKSAFFAGTPDMLGELRCNGAPVAELARWEPIRAIDLTPHLRRGRNCLAARIENHDGLNPALSGMALITYADGREQRLALDASWKLSDTPAPPSPGWDQPGFNAGAANDAGGGGWKPVEVSGGQPWGGGRNTEHFMPPAPYLRTTFTPAPNKAIRRATLYATALGVYQCSINGQRISDSAHAPPPEFSPGWTEYAKRVEHQTFNVTDRLKPGKNCLGAILGDGWYAGLMGYTGRRRFYNGPARFLAQLEIDYTDGTRDTITTGPTWRASFGPIRHADNYMGTDYDSTLEVPDWDLPSFDDSQSKPAETGLAQNAALRQSNVTARLNAAIRDGRLSLLVGPQALGDPAYGVVKALSVEYTANGVRNTISLPERQTLSLPQPGESGPLVITRAIFAAPPAPPPPPFLIEPQRADPVRTFEELPALSVTEPRPGRFVFDLGQNIVGWTRLRIPAGTTTRGQRLTVRHAEMLNPDGTLYTSNLRGATATDFYTLNGGQGGAQVLEPPFTFHGFRYVEITGLTSKPELRLVTGVVAHSDMRPAGNFTSSNPLLNRLVENIRWGQKGNYFEVPTDCPQRDERLGWTGDAQFFINTAAYTFDISAFMARWLNTLCHDAQLEDGTFAHVAPRVNERGGSTAWGDAAIVCTHALAQTCDDPRLIAANYEPMRRYMDWLDTKTTSGIANVGGFGDWLNLSDPTSQDLIDTAYRAHLCQLMADMARTIGNTDDESRFSAAHEATVAAFRARFLAPDGALKESGQTGYALAFTMDLIPTELRAQSASHFAAAVARTNNHLATGFIGTPRLLPALHNAGLSDLAAKLLLKDDYPSWLYQVKLGATTMWERWDGWTPERGFQNVGMNSFNHYAFGSVGDYLYRHIAGIAPASPGYQTIRIAPTLVDGLDHATAAHTALSGLIKSSWRRTPRGIDYHITIPPNTTAEVLLPMNPNDTITESGREIPHTPNPTGPSLAISKNSPARITIPSGTYHFSVNQR